MIEQRYIDLMNGELDGVNTAAKSADLREYLARNDEARHYYQGLIALYEVIDSDPEQNPPPDLEEKIISSIRPRKYVSARTGRGFSARLAAWLYPPSVKYAATFATGIFLGVIIYSIIGYDGRGGGSIDNSQLYGTMKSIESTDGFAQLESIKVDLDDVQGQVRFHESGSVLLAEVSLRSTAEIEWVLQFDEDVVSFDGFRRVDGQKSDIVAQRAETRIRQTGDNKHILFFGRENRSDTPIYFKIYSADHSLLFEQSLSPVAAE